jgi:multidrug resistance efflux pump
MLVGVAEAAEEIDLDRARVALEGAEARVAELGGAGSRSGAGSAEGDEPDHELAEAEAAVLRAQVRIEATDVSTGVVSTPT